MKKEDVKSKIGYKRWDDFCDFMVGQTVGIYPDGTTNYFECDVDNFLRKRSKRFFD